MKSPDDFNTLAGELREELTSGILPYWRQTTVDRRHGGFWGRVSGDGIPAVEAPKGAVLNARILWAFSAAGRTLASDTDHALATRAWVYLREHFWDAKHGGVFWMLDCQGTPVETKKQVYAQAFAVYALVEYHRLTGESESLACAVSIFRLLEQHAFDARSGGYFEAYSREWTLLDDVRLSPKDANEKKTMNTHLHVLEAYTHLFRVWPDAALETQLRGLLRIFLDTILDAETHHVVSFFDERWRPRTDFISYGHDVEASWLLVEAADVLGDGRLQEEVRTAALRIAGTVQAEGQDEDGGLLYEAHADGRCDDDKHGWAQAEAIVGFVNAYQLSGDRTYLDAARACWDFTRAHVVDGEGGEWFFRVSRSGVPYRSENKVGPWKGPYHNTRACLEVMRRASQGPSEEVEEKATDLVEEGSGMA